MSVWSRIINAHERENSREGTIAAWLDSVRSDAEFGWRQLRRNKVTSAAAILSLALAIGACTSAFRLIDAIFLRPLPVADPERLQVIAFENVGMDGKLAEYDSCSYPMFRRMREAVEDRAELIAVSYMDRTHLTYGSDEEMEKAHTQFVAGRMFPAFGLQPALGRLLTGGDDLAPGAHPFAVLSYDYWEQRFGRDQTVIGRKFRIGDDLYEIIGVAPRTFTGTETGLSTDVFIPMAMKNPRTLASPDNFWLRTFVKLKPGVKPGAVRDRLRAIFRDIQIERVKTFAKMPASQREHFFREQLLLEPAAGGRSNMQRDYSRPLGAIAILVALVLLIACANVANLMTARAGSRAHEMALRISIGAGRARLVQLLLLESAWIALPAALTGALFAWWSAPFVAGMINPPDDPARLVLSADWRVLAFGIALALAVTFLFGLGPALRASSVKPASALKGGEDPHSQRRLMHVLIAVQVSFCCLVLFTGGLFVDSFDRLSNQPTGFSAERILNLQTVSRTPQPASFWYEVEEHLRSVPDVERVALTVWPMMSGESGVGNISVDGAAPSPVFSDFLNVSPGWVEIMKIPLIHGRDFRDEETVPTTAIVNQAFARQFFDADNPTGKWFERVDGKGKRVRMAIVGVIRDARSRDNVRLPVHPTVYMPFQATTRGTFVVRTAGADPLAPAAALRAAVSQARPGFRVDRIRTQTEIDKTPLLRERLLAALALFFAFAALLLAGVGLYGVLDYSVQQRRREIGIRLAIGARSCDIVRTVTVEIARWSAAGVAAGVALGMVSAGYVESLLFGVKASDPRMLLVPALGILAIGLLAGLRPVLRATGINPLNMLRAE